MTTRRTIANWALFAVAVSSVPNSSAHAGPLCDWLFGHHKTPAPAYPVGPPTVVGMPVTSAPGYAASYGNYYGSMMPVIGPTGYGYSAAQPSGVAAATAPSIMSYVPDYRSSSYRAPVTYYRPLMTTDPNTGAQVVALAPCTSYEYQTQRIQTFGYNAIPGAFSTPPVQPAPQAMPTYTLPSGGVPLAANAPATLTPNNGTYSTGYGSYTTAVPFSTGPSALTPSYSSNYPAPQSTYGYSSNYGSYSALQPTLTVPPASTYPTAPSPAGSGYYGTSPYGSQSGGSCGNSLPTTVAPTYVPTVPGLVAPQAPAYIQPAPTTPSYNYPTTPPAGVFPPASGSSMDPNANIPPSLPPIVSPAPGTSAQVNRPQLRSIVRQPMPGENTQSYSQNYSQADQPSDTTNRSQVPSMSPIPEPTELQSQPRWNPGLLNEQDRTALRPVAPSPQDAQYLGQAKPIHWASFTSEAAKEEDTQPSSPSSISRLRAITPPVQSERPVQPPSNLEFHDSRSSLELSAPSVRSNRTDLPNTSTTAPVSSLPSRSTSGWKPTR
jgi:hypothetical protein